MRFTIASWLVGALLLHSVHCYCPLQTGRFTAFKNTFTATTQGQTFAIPPLSYNSQTDTLTIFANTSYTLSAGELLIPYLGAINFYPNASSYPYWCFEMRYYSNAINSLGCAATMSLPNANYTNFSMYYDGTTQGAVTAISTMFSPPVYMYTNSAIQYSILVTNATLVALQTGNIVYSNFSWSAYAYDSIPTNTPVDPNSQSTTHTGVTGVSTTVQTVTTVFQSSTAKSAESSSPGIGLCYFLVVVCAVVATFC